MRHFGLTDIELTVPMKYFGTVDYYATIAACRKVVIDDTARYDKRQKDTHRMDIVDTHGLKQLTVPVSKPEDVQGPLHWSDIRISRHGEWWHVIEETLASAYGRTPFFEFYIDRLRRFFAVSTPDKFGDVATLCREADKAVRGIIGLDNEVFHASEESPKSLSCYTENPTAPKTYPVEYYQVRSDKFGFVPNLSILDLIFNMGPESALILRQMTQ